jgi:hypothetical protein
LLERGAADEEIFGVVAAADDAGPSGAGKQEVTE